MTTARPRVVIYREVNAGADIRVLRLVGNCLKSEFPHDSLAFFDLNASPRIGDLALFGFRHELDDPHAYRATKRVSYRCVGGRDMLTYEADGGMLMPLMPDTPILGTLMGVYIPAFTRESAESRALDELHAREIQKHSAVAAKINELSRVAA